MIKNVKKYITNMIGQSENEIFKTCKQYYLDKLKTCKSKQPNPNVMLDICNIITKTFKTPGRDSNKIKNRLKNLIFDIRIQSNMKTKMAQIFHPKDLLYLIVIYLRVL